MFSKIMQSIAPAPVSHHNQVCLLSFCHHHLFGIFFYRFLFVIRPPGAPNAD